jgi:group II intron reverse transcriptase/maturase
MTGTKNLGSISTRIRRIANLARKYREGPTTNLAHYIDEYFLMEAYARTRKDGAAGIDGQTAGEYGENLEANLRSLLDRLKLGLYRAPPVRRVHIPKGSGSKTRPIGIPTFEDKVLQRAVTMVLEPLYEQEFLDCSHGFRPGRSAHTALKSIWETITSMGNCWVLEVDIKSFFDDLDHSHLRSFLDKRVRDGVIRRVIGKWLKAGVLEAGIVQRQDTGTPQGGVISPLLANLYLHEVVDRWFAEDVQPRLLGRAELIRYADDFVIVLAVEKDAQRVLEVLPKRLGRFGLTLHPEKTRLLNFRRPPRDSKGGGKGPGSFNFLGFTHFWGKSRRGKWVLRQKTASDRFGRAMTRMREWCRFCRHDPIGSQQRQLSKRLRGHYAYYGITGNFRSISNFHRQVTREWRKWLNRRSQQKSMTWERFQALLVVYPLARPRIVHRTTRAANPS